MLVSKEQFKWSIVKKMDFFFNSKEVKNFLFYLVIVLFFYITNDYSNKLILKTFVANSLKLENVHIGFYIILTFLSFIYIY
uniref:hypothetical protein n=1 Tax=Mesoflavibacter zeaxanthinifaciens TaxID=393060 RepID=UPI003A955DF7